MTRKILRNSLILVLLAAPLLGPAQDAETEPVQLNIDKWFLLGPFATPLPANLWLEWRSADPAMP